MNVPRPVAVEPVGGNWLPSISMRNAFADTSSLLMLPWPEPSLRTAPLLGLDSETWNVSRGSNLVSPLTVTEIVWLVTPVPNCNAPEVAT